MEKKFSFKEAAAFLQAETQGNEISIKDVYRRMPEGPINKTFISLAQRSKPRRIELILNRCEDVIGKAVGELPAVNPDCPWSVQGRVRQLWEVSGVVDDEPITEAIQCLTPEMIQVLEYHRHREHRKSHLMQVYNDTLQVIIRERIDGMRTEWESAGRSWAPVVQLARKLYPQVEFELPRYRHAVRMITVQA